MRKIIDSYWFTQLENPQTIGIIKILDEFEGDRYFIGTSSENTKEEDEQYIADTGAKFPKEVGDLLFLI